MPIQVLAPPLGTNVETLTLLTWYRQEGEQVLKDEPLFMVETDKATLDVEAPASGILCGVTARAGDQILALRPIGYILQPGEAPSGATDGQRAPDAPPANAPTDSQLSMAPGAVSGTAIEDRPSASAPPAQGGGTPRAISGEALPPKGSSSVAAEGPAGDVAATLRRTFISPRAKMLAERIGLGWRELTGSGPEGAIVERDVIRYRSGQAAGVAGPRSEREIAGLEATDVATPEHSVDVVPLDGVRARIAERMLHSAASTAPVTLMAETDATGLVEQRARAAADGMAVSYNAVLFQILARALQEHPRMNATLDGETIRIWRSVSIGLAVDSEDGLRVPVLRGVEALGLAEIEQAIRAVVSSVRDGSIRPDQMRGGTFTL